MEELLQVNTRKMTVDGDSVLIKELSEPLIQTNGDDTLTVTHRIDLPEVEPLYMAQELTDEGIGLSFYYHLHSNLYIAVSVEENMEFITKLFGIIERACALDELEDEACE